ncbi:MAG: hypothetical protein Alpg2KO_24860 [Alphaproteobacteria bacterium]
MSEKKLAVFDLDATLTRRDTLLPWLEMICGKGRVRRAAMRAGMAHVWAGRPGDRRTRFKRLWLRRLLKGVEVARAEQAAHELAAHLDWIPPRCSAREGHLKRGDTVLLATGAATLLGRILMEHRFGGVTDVLGTELEIAGGHFTGEMSGPNSVRQAKAKRVKDWIEQHGPFEHISGYGNAPHDLPMLALCDQRTIV